MIIMLVHYNANQIHNMTFMTLLVSVHVVFTLSKRFLGCYCPFGDSKYKAYKANVMVLSVVSYQRYFMGIVSTLMFDHDGN